MPRTTRSKCSAPCRWTSAIREQADAGKPTVVADPDGRVAEIYKRHRPPRRGQDRRAGQGPQRQVPEHRHPEHLIAQVYGVIARAPQSRGAVFFDDPSGVTAMSIKSDKWIRRMAEQHGMIEPFEPGQVREVERPARSSPTAPRATATTSAARSEFKLFTNIN